MSDTISTLTPMQAAFASHLADGNRQTQAARLAGYKFPDVEAVRLLKLPSIQSALRTQLDRVFGEGAETCARFILSAVTNEDFHEETRRKCAIWVLDRAGAGIESKSSSPIEELLRKPASELTFQELLAVSAHTSEQLANLKAIPVDSAKDQEVKY